MRMRKQANGGNPSNKQPYKTPQRQGIQALEAF